MKHLLILSVVLLLLFWFLLLLLLLLLSVLARLGHGVAVDEDDIGVEAMESSKR